MREWDVTSTDKVVLDLGLLVEERRPDEREGADPDESEGVGSPEGPARGEEGESTLANGDIGSPSLGSAGAQWTILPWDGERRGPTWQQNTKRLILNFCYHVGEQYSSVGHVVMTV